MNNNLNDDIKDKLTKVCVCKSINRKTIKNGAKTVDEVKHITGAGSGSCKGCRCIPKIKELLDKEMGC